MTLFWPGPGSGRSGISVEAGIKEKKEKNKGGDMIIFEFPKNVPYSVKIQIE